MSCQTLVWTAKNDRGLPARVVLNPRQCCGTISCLMAVAVTWFFSTNGFSDNQEADASVYPHISFDIHIHVLHLLFQLIIFITFKNVFCSLEVNVILASEINVKKKRKKIILSTYLVIHIYLVIHTSGYQQIHI